MEYAVATVLCTGWFCSYAYIVSHQPLTRFACWRAVIIHYSLVANAIYTQQIYGAMAIKSGRVIAWKVIMTVEAAGLRGSGC